MILIVDDDFEYAETLQQVLENSGLADIRRATNGKQALDVVDEHGVPSVVILDIMIPRDEEDVAGSGPPRDRNELPNGVRILEKLQEKGVPSGRVLVITAFYHKKLFERMKEVAIPEERILLKPARTREILDWVKRIHHERSL